jgi:hypothetical protein
VIIHSPCKQVVKSHKIPQHLSIEPVLKLVEEDEVFIPQMDSKTVSKGWVSCWTPQARLCISSGQFGEDLLKNPLGAVRGCE